MSFFDVMSVEANVDAVFQVLPLQIAFSCASQACSSHRVWRNERTATVATTTQNPNLRASAPTVRIS